MKSYLLQIQPTFSSMKRFIFWIGLFCSLLSIGGVLCSAILSSGINWRVLEIFVVVPFGVIFAPILIMSFSYKIKLAENKIIFYQFFLPVKTICLEKIKRVRFEKIAVNGQPCAMTVDCDNEKYIYPVRLFEESAVKQLINHLNEISGNKHFPSESEFRQTPVVDFSKSKTRERIVRYVMILFFILLIIILYRT